MTNLFPEKRKPLLSQWPQFFCGSKKKYIFPVMIHGVSLQFETDDENFYRDLKNFFPLDWQASVSFPIRVQWSAPSTAQGEWDDIVDPNCHFVDSYVSQRDFLVKKEGTQVYQVMAHQRVDDGLYNFLRYMLPLELLKQDKVLFHSSCVLSPEGQPYLFFGPSGAGKTTIAQLCQGQGGEVLGDDMNLLSFKENSIFIEAASVGQRIFDKKNFGKTWPLDRLFWLNKGEFLESSPLSQGQSKFYLSSFANFFWNQLDQETYNRIFSLVAKMKKQLNLYNFTFPKNEEVWDYVQSIK